MTELVMPESNEKIANCLERVADDHSGNFTEEDAFVVECAILSLRALSPSPEVTRLREALHAIDIEASNTIPSDGKDAAFATLSAIIRIINPFRLPRALSPSPDRLREALTDAREAIASLPRDELGWHEGSYGEGPMWPLKDELLAKIDAALATPNAQEGEGA